MRLFSRVGANVTGLVLQTVEGLVTERAFVGPGQVLARLVVALLLGILEERSHEAHGGSGHGRVGSRGGGVLMVQLLFGSGLRVEQVGKTELRGGG
jgi:hypothetical protein